jgi:uncharacterized protein
VRSGIFLDTAGWFASLSPPERGHQQARTAYIDAVQRGLELVTTPLVIAEVHTLLLRWRDPATATRFLEIAFNPEIHRVVQADRALIASSIARWIRRFADQSFSLCDAVSFEVMRQARLTRCLTFDRHFAAVGFQILGGVR